MPSITKGVGSFTADNIVSILRALPETNGTYAQVIARAAEHGAQLSATTLGKWVTTGRADIEAGNAHNAYARFSQRYDSIMAEHCSPDANRNVNSTQRSRSWNGPASAATTRSPPRTVPCRGCRFPFKNAGHTPLFSDGFRNWTRPNHG